MDNDNIIAAMVAEQEYLAEKAKGTRPDIHHYLDKYGYADIEKYHSDKTQHQIRSLGLRGEVLPYISAEEMHGYVDRQEPVLVFYIDTQDSYAFIPVEYDDYATLASENLVPIQFGYSAGRGVIVSASGDLRIYLLIPSHIDIDAYWFLSKFERLFKNLGMDAEGSGNDILVGGKKVIGSAWVTENGMTNLLFQVSFNSSSEHLSRIERVCGSADKQPGYIDSSIISPIQLREEFMSWLQ